jgi:hypothetical protein
MDVIPEIENEGTLTRTARTNGTIIRKESKSAPIKEASKIDFLK